MGGKTNTACMVSVAIASGLGECRREPSPRCVDAVNAHDWPSAYESCQAELAHTNDPARAVDAAKAALYLHRYREALPLATLGLPDPATAADAHYCVGHARFRLGDYAEARDHLEKAVKLHHAANNPRAESRDYQQLAGALFEVGEYQRALDAQIGSRDAALRAHDEGMTVYADLARADILTRIGDLPAAELAVEQVLVHASDPTSRVHALIRQAVLHIEQNHGALARAPLQQALREELANEKPSARVLEALHLNLSYVERKAHELKAALDELELAKKIGTDDVSYRMYRGLVLAEMGRLAEARDDLEAAEAANPQGDASWRVPFSRARVAAMLHSTAEAIASDHRAIAKVATLAHNSGAFGPTVIANHREPHLHLIGLLAADRQWNDVLDVVAAMDGQSLLDSSEVSTDQAPVTGEDSPQPTPPAAATPQPAPDAAKLAAAWRGRHLTIVVPGGERVWRLDVVDGRVSGCDVGDAIALGKLAHALEADPANADAGSQLGQAMLPDVPAQTRIELLVIGPLARAPLAALRIGDDRAITRHPLVRVPGLLPRTPVERAGGAVIAIGDPREDLPQAASEARKLAERLHGTALIGKQATRAALAVTAGIDLLHVAAHTTRGRGAAMLELADGPVSLDDIARLAPAPRVVVLASCASSGRDDPGSGSLTGAFLDAGADIVVGTRWSIDDAEAARFIESFYAAGGDRDPVRALMETQRTSKLRPATWAAFEVFLARPAR